MRYNDWEAKIDALNKRATPLLVDEDVLQEEFIIPPPARGSSHHCIVRLGYSEITYYVDGSKEFSIRGYYVAGEKIWQTVLGSLTTKVELAELLHKKLVDGLVQPYVKEAVLERLTADKDDIPDNTTIIKEAADRRLRKLAEMLPKPKTWINDSFNLPCPVHGHALTCTIRQSGGSVTYSDSDTMRGAWSLLTNYEAIEATVQEFNKLYIPLLKFLDKGG